MRSQPFPQPDVVPVRTLRRSPARRLADRQMRLVMLLACVGGLVAFAAVRLADASLGGEVALVATAFGFLLSAKAGERLVLRR